MNSWQTDFLTLFGESACGGPPRADPKASEWENHNMRRRGWVSAGLALVALAMIGTPARAQSPTDFAQTAAYAAAHQNEDGGFAAGPGQASTLGSTNTGLRVLDYVGGSVPDVAGCIRFVKSCKVKHSGFAQTPGGKPDVVTTAIGLLAAAELKIADKTMIDDAIAYFSTNAKSFEEVRMSIAGLEGVGSLIARLPALGRADRANAAAGRVVRRGCQQSV